MGTRSLLGSIGLFERDGGCGGGERAGCKDVLSCCDSFAMFSKEDEREVRVGDKESECAFICWRRHKTSEKCTLSGTCTMMRAPFVLSR